MLPLFLLQAQAINQHLMLMLHGRVYISLSCPLFGQLWCCLGQPLATLRGMEWPIEMPQNPDLVFGPAAVAGGFCVSVSCAGNTQS